MNTLPTRVRLCYDPMVCYRERNILGILRLFFKKRERFNGQLSRLGYSWVA